MLLISPVPPPAGGIANWTEILIRRGLPDGWQVRLVDTSVGTNRGVFETGPLIQELRRAARVLGRTLRELLLARPQVLHVNVDPFARGLYRDGLAIAMAAARGVPTVLHHRGGLSEGMVGAGRFHLKWFEKLATLATINLVLDGASHDFVDAMRGAVRLLPNYFDDDELPRVAPPVRAADERLRAVFVGAVAHAKGCDLILEAAASLPDVDIELVGRVYPEMQAQLDRAPGNVSALGERPHGEVLDCMRRAHVFVFPTLHPEGFPNVVCEAMAVGIPVVATARGAIPEMLAQGGGVLIEPTAAALVGELRTLGANERLRETMGREGQERAFSQYAFSAVAMELARLYEGLGEGRLPARSGTAPGERS